MLYGILDISFWGFIIALLIMTHLTIMGVTLYLHRCQTHRGIDLHPIVSHFFRFWIWLTSGMETKIWVAIHRKHHAHCETTDDPHSPMILGIKRLLLEGAELYRAEAKNPETMEKYGAGTPDDWLERNVYTRHSAKGVVLMLLLDLLLFGIPGITMWALQMIWIPFFAAGVINGIGHYWGYRNFEVPDASRNISPIAWFLGGEELHNNHHTYGTSAKFSVKWWEFDIGWGYIQVLRFFGLAKVRHMAPKPVVVEGKTQIDKDTVVALLRNRFQVMSRYSKDVLIPVFNQEKAKAGAASRALLAKAKSVLSLERSLVPEVRRQQIAELLQDYSHLDMVYQYQQKLLDIWEWTTASNKELIDAIQEWCRQAEATGIEALQEFSRKIRSYALAPQET